MTAALIFRIALASLGASYIVRWVRRRQRREPTKVSTVELTGDSLKAHRWEIIREKSVIGALCFFIPMAAAALLNAPIWLTGGLLIGTGLCMALYLVACVVTGWFQGRASMGR